MSNNNRSQSALKGRGIKAGVIDYLWRLAQVNKSFTCHPATLRGLVA